MIAAAGGEVKERIGFIMIEDADPHPICGIGNRSPIHVCQVDSSRSTAAGVSAACR